MLHSLQITGDGSHTVLNEEFKTTYHSKHGAIQESRHVFISAGLEYLINTGVREFYILEMGFGTGLNTLLTYLYAEHNKIVVHYTAYEKFPLNQGVLQSLNYPSILDCKSELFEKLHHTTERTFISTNFDLEIIYTDFTSAIFSGGKFNLIYFDAFDPETQPELWSEVLFQYLFKACAIGAVLVTYSAKGQVRRNLESVGFKVERIAGPPGKREMIRAVKLGLT